MNLDTYRRILAGESRTAVLSPRALWRLTGPDAARYLNGQVTNDVASLAEGQASYAAVCTAKGRMEGDVAIALHAGGFYLDADPVLRESLGARLEKYLIADDAVFEDVSDLWSLRHVFGATPPPAPEAGFVIAYARFGVPGHDVWVASEANANPVSAGATVEADVIETLRLEHGLPRWGAELTTATLPPEAGPHLLEAISYTKGCYVGQETIARLKSVGHVNRSLVFLQSDSAAFPAPGAKLMHAEHEAGVVTSSGYSPRLEKGIALGYAQRQAAACGALLRADGLNLTVAAPLSSQNRP
jgi:folate-binding protein YgfZ